MNESQPRGEDHSDGGRRSFANVRARETSRAASSTTTLTRSSLSDPLDTVAKVHPFSDGNKRTAAALFAYFLDRNGIELDRAIPGNMLTALTLIESADGGSRTHTPLRATEFESVASAIPPHRRTPTCCARRSLTIP